MLVTSFHKQWKPKSSESSLMELCGFSQFPHCYLLTISKYMGGMNHLSQVRKTYGFDRKSKRYWIQPFFVLCH